MVDTPSLDVTSLQAPKLDFDHNPSLPAWDCSHSMHPSDTKNCWAITAFETCSGGQWAYDVVMRVGGSSKRAFEMFGALQKADCSSCNVSKADCANSMFPNEPKVCWAATAY